MPTVTIEIPNKRREDMLIGALEGGSNYWYWIGEEATKIIEKYNPQPFGDAFSVVMWKAIETGETIPIHNLENRSEKLGEINLASIAKGEQLMADKYPQHFADLHGETDDAITADVWFQLSSLGELIYG